jgi:hypothetical protein
VRCSVVYSLRSIFGNMTENYSWNMVCIFHESLEAESRLKVHQIGVGGKGADLREMGRFEGRFFEVE